MAKQWNLAFLLFAGVLLQSCGGGGENSSKNPDPSPKDTTRPTVIATNPSNNTSAVPVNATLSATFSEPVDPSTVGSAFTLSQGATVCAGSVACSGNMVTFTPAAKLANSLPYTATLSTAVKDLAGNALASPYTWNFITSDCNSISLIKQFDLGSAVAGTGFKALATDGTSIYLYKQDYQASAGSLFKINPQTGQITNTYSIPLVPLTSTNLYGINFIADITWHDGALWASGVYLDSQFLQGVFRVNLNTGLSENQIPVAAGIPNEVVILQGLASNGTNLFVGIDRNFQAPTPGTHLIVKFNPATSAEIPLSPALLATPGQITRMDFGGGFLWLFNNPNFQKVDPASGTVLFNYCKNDGGANILYLDGSVWSINDTILLNYSLP